MIRLGHGWAAVAVVAVAFGCGDDGSRAPIELADGTEVRVDDGGSLVLAEGSRELFVLPASASPLLRTFDEQTSGDFAIWTFERSNESEVPLERGRIRTTDDGAVEVPFASDDPEVQATLTIAPADGVEATRFRLEWTGLEADSVSVPIRCDEEGSFHGFGEQYNATEQTGEAFTIMVTEQGIGRQGTLRALQGDEHTTYFPMPYYVDVRGHGALFTTDHRVEVDLCATDPEVARFEVVAGAPLEWLVFHGPTVPDVIRQLGDVAGRPKQPPAWAWELWISAQGGQTAVLAEAQKLVDHQIPAGVIWSQDWSGLRMNVDGGFGVQYRWAVDPSLYPDLAAMIAQLDNDHGMRFLGYANPFIETAQDPAYQDFFQPMRDMGLLIRNPDGEAYVFSAPNGSSSHADFTDPDARAFVKDALVAMVNDFGMDGWMSDFGEWNPLDAVMDSGVDPRAYHNHYPVDWHGVVREALDEARPDGDYVTFARSGWTGVQGEAMIHWVGDQEASWSETDGLPTVVPALINLGMAGQPFVTHDIAGFSGGPSTKELYQRWTELGAFTPIMRTHEGNNRDENWNWDGGPSGDDAETIAHFRRFAQIHQALGPQLEAWAEEAARTGMPMVRHMMIEFPDDPQTHALDEQYMLGDAFLVAPVLREGVTSRQVYLPAGTWYHLWTGDRFEGGTSVTVDAPIGSPPVFSRDEDRPDLRAIP